MERRSFQGKANPDYPAGSITVWPATLSPATSPVYSRVEITVNASPPAVWAVLIRATAWPEWFPRVTRVRLDGGGDELVAETVFRWRISGQPFRSRVRVFEASSQLAWESRNPLIHTFHSWHLLPAPDGCCRVVDQECQRGALPWAARPILRRALHRVHAEWLDSLAERLAATDRPSR